MVAAEGGVVTVVEVAPVVMVAVVAPVVMVAVVADGVMAEVEALAEVVEVVDRTAVGVGARTAEVAAARIANSYL